MRVGLVLVVGLCACDINETRDEDPGILQIHLPPTPCAIMHHNWIGAVPECPFEIGYIVKDRLADLTGWNVTTTLGSMRTTAALERTGTLAVNFPATSTPRDEEQYVNFHVEGPTGERDPNIVNFTVVNPSRAPAAYLWTVFWTEGGRYITGSAETDCEDNVTTHAIVGGDLGAFDELKISVHDVDPGGAEDIDFHTLTPSLDRFHYSWEPGGLCRPDSEGESFNKVDPKFRIDLVSDGILMDTMEGPELDID